MKSTTNRGTISKKSTSKRKVNFSMLSDCELS